MDLREIWWEGVDQIHLVSQEGLCSMQLAS